MLTINHFKKINEKALEHFEYMVEVRRDLHQHPELSGQESWTAAYLADRLTACGLRIQRGMGGHGMFADLITDPSAPTVALRVDMDALPIHEINDQPYRSRRPGVMHACGHDVHSAIGVGTAQILSEMAEDLPGNIRFIFQPEEEEITGALRMIRAGALSDPTPKAIFGLHVAPLPVGKLGWTSDLFLAGFDHYLAILYPHHKNITPVHLDGIARRCCQVIRSFNQYDLPETWDEMQAFWQLMQNPPDSLRNFITYNASLDDEDPEAWHGQFGIGIKAANHHLRRTAIGRIKASLNTICLATNTGYELEPMGSMLDMRNHPRLVRRGLQALKDTIGAQNLISLKAAFPFNCEDFAYYTKHIPGAMYWLGAATPSDQKYAILHTPNFDVDEKCMVTGSASMAALLMNALKE